MGIEIDLSDPHAAERIAEFYELKTREAMKTAVLECERALTVNTPVDTGRAREGWYCTVNSPGDAMPDAGKYAMPNPAAKVSEMGDFTITDTLYIANNLPYIARLNDGYSRQQPARFVERAAAAGQMAAVKSIRNS